MACGRESFLKATWALRVATPSLGSIPKGVQVGPGKDLTNVFLEPEAQNPGMTF